jgi:pimeloyl-ACP methyl ester carboxylesterase
MTATLDLKVNWKNVPTLRIVAGGVEFAYRDLGTNNPGTPVVFLVHLAAVLDNWDPRVVDGLAAEHRVITFDNRGVGASSGSPATSIDQMATDAITFIKAMGFEQVDLFGFSMGGMIAQEIVLKEPHLVRKMILAGTLEQCSAKPAFKSYPAAMRFGFSNLRMRTQRSALEL